MSAAEELRAAARSMRERATDATPGPWNSTLDAQVVAGYGSPFDGEQLADCFQVDPAGDANAEHIASWHPAVALAVADWLEDLGTRAEEIADTLLGSSDELRERVIAANVPGYQHALTVARTYLGAT